MLGIRNGLALSSYKNETSIISSLQSTQDNLVLQSNNNTSDISDLQSDITTIDGKFPQYYQTLIFRQKCDNNNLFTDKAEVENYNESIDNPETSNQFSIINKSDDIKGDFGLYIYKIKIHSYTDITGTASVSRHIPGKDIFVTGQVYNPLWSVVTQRGDDGIHFYSNGMFRASCIMGGLKRSTTTPTHFGYELINTGQSSSSSQHYMAVGQIANGYNYFCLQTAGSTGSETQVYYRNGITEVYQIGKTDYERSSHTGSDTITTPLTGTTLYDLNYLS